MLTRECSQAIYSSSCAVIPGGVNSPVRSFKEVGIPPMIVARGKGDTIWDADGHSYIDFCMGWGALILGHADEGVAFSVKEQMDIGACFGITTEAEVEMAKSVTSIFPGMDMVRFVSSGTEAVMSAIRLSRGFTGKSCVIKYSGNYHGHSDALLVKAGSGVSHLSAASSLGVPSSTVENTFCLPYNDIEATRNCLESRDDIACVILEPVAANMGVVPASFEFIQMLREETQKKGVILIFDEVITGMRVGLCGSYSLFGIVPDLYCLGKIVGGGLPAAAFGGRKEIMHHLSPLGSVYQAGTLSGSPLAMRAGLATIDRIKEPNFYSELDRKAALLLDPIEKAAKASKMGAQLSRCGSMFTLFFSKKAIHSQSDLIDINLSRYARFFRYLFKKGIYFSPSQYEACFVSIAHSDEHLKFVADTVVRYLENEEEV